MRFCKVGTSQATAGVKGIEGINLSLVVMLKENKRPTKSSDSRLVLFNSSPFRKNYSVETKIILTKLVRSLSAVHSGSAELHSHVCHILLVAHDRMHKQRLSAASL